MAQIVLSDLTAEFSDFQTQFNNGLASQPAWKGQLTTLTSSTLVDIASTVGAFDQARIYRQYEDCFPDTAQSDDAVRAITKMQGLRMSRMLPASITVALTSTLSGALDPLQQFMINGTYWFNRDALVFVENVPLNVTLFQGQIKSYNYSGASQDFQNIISDEQAFTVSDQDTQIEINNVLIPKSDGDLWNYRAQPAWADMSTADGRLLVQFGTSVFGSSPSVNDVVTLTYAVTTGANGNSIITDGQTVQLSGTTVISGTVDGNPSGGADQQAMIVYKNVASGSFGTYSSAITRSQYLAQVSTYPGIIDAVTQAQREINPEDPQWMNVIRVTKLTNSVWTQQQNKDYIAYLQRTTMYSGRFLLVDAIPIVNDVAIDVYAYNVADLTQVQQTSIAAIQQFFAPKQGILMTDFFLSDLDTAIKTANNGLVSYVIINAPTTQMVVNAPNAADITYSLISAGGTLGPLVYSYSVSISNSLGDGPPNNWVFPQVTGTISDFAIQLQWNEVPGATVYKVWGRTSTALGLLATINAVPGGPPQVWTDDGSIDPTGGLPNTLNLNPIRYNSLGSLTVNSYIASRQQRLDGSPERNSIQSI